MTNMYGDRGFHIDRFGEPYQQPTNVVGGLVSKQHVDAAILFVRAEVINRIGDITKQFTVAQNYIDVKEKRLVRAKPAKDKTDLVIKEQLDYVGDNFDFTKPDAVSIAVNSGNKKRRIAGVGKSMHGHDVVIRNELAELYDLNYKYQEEMNKRLVYIKSQIGVVESISEYKGRQQQQQKPQTRKPDHAASETHVTDT